MQYLQNLLENYETISLISLIAFSFTAGFIDAVAGGGGLIQLPALLIALPQTPLPTLFGTNKIAALAGTSISAIKYAKRIKFNYKLLIILSASAGLASFLGAQTLHYINVNTLKPIILIALIGMAVFTYLKKDLGSAQTKNLNLNKQIMLGSLLGFIIGFYDGFFGPGTGTFLVLGLVVLLGFEFVQASAYAKIINCSTNVFALLVFVKQGNYLTELAILLAISNISGNLLGTNLALKNGNSFVRLVFLVIVSIMILRYGYDIFLKG